MGIEIRAARPEEMERFTQIVGNSTIMSPEVSQGVRPEWTFCAFEDGKIATTYAVLPLTMQFNGESVSVAGVTCVSTLPIYRRRSYLRRVTAAHFELLHELGEQPIAILLASQAAIYQRYGYAVVSTRNAYNVEPHYLEFALDQLVTGTFCEVSDNELELLMDLYQRFVAERIGYMHRDRPWWENVVLVPPPVRSVLRKLVYEEAGEPLGYVIYTLEPLGVPGSRQRLTIRDLVWLTVSTYRAIWNYLTRMEDLASNIIWDRVPSDDPLPHLLVEPRILHATSRDGLMARIVDVERALPKRRYYEESTLTFEILDDLCPWNRGQWKLETTAAGASVSRTSDEPQLVIPVSTLAMLVFGQISATEAVRMGRLDVLEHSALPLWDKVMHTTYRPSFADRF